MDAAADLGVDVGSCLVAEDERRAGLDPEPAAANLQSRLADDANRVCRHHNALVDAGRECLRAPRRREVLARRERRCADHQAAEHCQTERTQATQHPLTSPCCRDSATLIAASPVCQTGRAGLTEVIGRARVAGTDVPPSEKW